MTSFGFKYPITIAKVQGPTLKIWIRFIDASKRKMADKKLSGENYNTSNNYTGKPETEEKLVY